MVVSLDDSTAIFFGVDFSLMISKWCGNFLKFIQLRLSDGIFKYHHISDDTATYLDIYFVPREHPYLYSLHFLQYPQAPIIILLQSHFQDDKIESNSIREISFHGGIK